MFVFVDGVFAQGFACICPSDGFQIQEFGGVFGHFRQYGGEVGGQHGKGVDEFAAYFVQAFVLAFLFRQFPRFVGINVFVDNVRQGHDVAQGFGVFAAFVAFGNGFALCGQFCQQCAVGHVFQTAFKAFGDET